MVNISDNIQEFDIGEVVYLEATYTAPDGNLYDPDTISVRIYDPTGALRFDGVGARQSIGVYGYEYTLPVDAQVGWWLYKYTAVTITNTDVQKGQFKVRNPERRLYTLPAYVYSRAGQDENFVSEKDVNYFITEAMKEVDDLMGKVYDYSTRATEWFDTTQPNPNTKVTKLFLRFTPIRNVMSVEEYDMYGDLEKTYTNSDYYIDLDTGMLGLRTLDFGHQERRVRVVYDYGFDTVPADIQQLTTVIAAIKIYLNHIGSSVDDVTSFSACGISMGVGEPYTASERALQDLTKEMTRIIGAIGRVRQSIFIV